LINQKNNSIIKTFRGSSMVERLAVDDSYFAAFRGNLGMNISG